VGPRTLNPRFYAEQRQRESQPERYAEKFMRRKFLRSKAPPIAMV
jgi:hypothetical protein